MSNIFFIFVVNIEKQEMLRIDFNSVDENIELPEVTMSMDYIIDQLDKFHKKDTQVTISDKDLVFNLSRDNVEEYWEVERVKLKTDGYTNKSIKA